MQKTDLIIEEKCQSILSLITQMAKTYPSLKKDNDSVVNAYAIIKKLNKDNTQSIFPIINTMKGKDNELNYVVHNTNNKYILFNHTAKTKSPWFTVRQNELSFTYNENTFPHLFQLYREDKSILLQILKETEVELKATNDFYNAFNMSHYINPGTFLTEDNIAKNSHFIIDQLSRYLNQESQMALFMTMEENYVESWINYVVPNHPTPNFNQDILDLYQQKIIQILKDEFKQYQNEKTASRHTNINHYNNSSVSLNTRFKYEDKYKSRLTQYSDLMSKLNLYANLNEDLTANNEMKKNKI